MHSLAADVLAENDFITLEVLLKSKSAAPVITEVLLFRFSGQAYAYINHCMHMHRPLNCQQDAVFDPERRWLRCSMHGFLFEPTTGVCISPVCEGQALQAIKVEEQNGMIVFKEKHLQVLGIHSYHPRLNRAHDA
jgi:nitrite reductase/ring-hydroxylating ferredoxin subunit